MKTGRRKKNKKKSVLFFSIRVRSFCSVYYRALAEGASSLYVARWSDNERRMIKAYELNWILRSDSWDCISSILRRLGQFLFLSSG